MTESIEDIIKRGVEPEDLLNAVNDAINQAKLNIKKTDRQKWDDLFTTLRTEYITNTESAKDFIEEVEAGNIPYLKLNYNER